MADVAIVHVKAGDGGDGLVHFRREKYVPRGGPDGGDGGDGGSVLLRGNANLRTLDAYMSKQRFLAENGGPGRKQKQSGKDGEHLYLEVPLGTVVWELRVRKPGVEREITKGEVKLEGARGADSRGAGNEEFEMVGMVDRKRVLAALQLRRNPKSRQREEWKRLAGGVMLEKLGEIVNPEDELVLARGGRGGWGNDRFKSATNRTPREAEPGEKGEARWLVLELKLLADVGLVGLPNAGKSTLLSVLTAARPKIADYEFTTLEPNLGVMKMGKEELVVADIPGLIEGASEGRGLGDEFLRHVERCRLLVHLVAPREYGLGVEGEGVDESKLRTQGLELGRRMFEDYQMINQELFEYTPDLAEKPQVVVVNKADLLSEVEEEEVVKFFEEKGVEVLVISAVTGAGVEDLKKKLIEQVK